jgi:hypothetical protein
MKFGIDVSKWQGNFDFAKAKKENNIEFVILKIGGGDNICYKDSEFNSNYNKCKAIDLPVGCYFFGHALDKKTAIAEAKYWCDLMQNKQFEYPVFYDVEGDMLKLSKRELTDVIKYVLSYVESRGYWVGIYTSHSHFESEVFDSELKRYSHWVASWQVTQKPILTQGGSTQIWQFGGSKNSIRSTKINGITVDQNYCYMDYESRIKELGLNNYKKSEQKLYTVVKGDTLWGIAKRFYGSGREYNRIMKANNLNSSVIYVGEKLIIPKKE